MLQRSVQNRERVYMIKQQTRYLMRYQSITSAVKDVLDHPLQVLFVAKYKGKQEIAIREISIIYLKFDDKYIDNTILQRNKKFNKIMILLLIQSLFYEQLLSLYIYLISVFDYRSTTKLCVLYLFLKFNIFASFCNISLLHYIQVYHLPAG